MTVRRYNPQIEKNLRPFIGPRLRLQPETRSFQYWDGVWKDVGGGLPWFEITDYGADRSGMANSTMAIKSAMDAAEAAGGGIVYAADGIYRFRPYDRDSVIESEFIIDIPENVWLFGSGANTVFTFLGDDDTTYEIADGHYIGFRLNGNNIVSDLVLRGNKDQITLAGEKIFYGFYCAEGSSNILFRNVNVSGIPSSGGNKESFAFTSREACHHIRWEHCSANDNNGSGFSLSANNPLPEVEGNNGGGYMWLNHCEASNNTWQGVTIFAAEHVQVKDSTFTNNERVGINVEWSRDVLISGCESAYNIQNGWRVLGRSNNIILSDSYIHSNGATAELSVSAGGFHRQIDGEDVFGMSGTILIRNNRVLRKVEETGAGPSVHHLQIRTREIQAGETLHADYSFPRITLEQDDAATWNITGWPSHVLQEPAGVGPSLNNLPPGTRFTRVPIVSKVLVGPLANLAIGVSSTTLIPYEGSDNLDPGAITIIAQAQGADIYSDFIFAPNRRYRLRVRYKVQQPLKNDSELVPWDNPDMWGVSISRVSGDGGPAGSVRNASILDSGEWVEGEVVARTREGRYRLLIFYTQRSSVAVTPGTIHIDRIDVEELASDNMQSDYLMLGGRRIRIALTQPVSGSHHAGDTFLRQRAVEGEPAGWVIANAGGGTIDTLVGVTVSTRINPENLRQISVNPPGSLRIEEYIRIAGATRQDGIGDVTKFNVNYIDTAGNVYLDTVPNEAVVNAVATYAQPRILQQFVLGESRFVSELPVGSSSAIALPLLDSRRGWDERVEMIKGRPRKVMRREPLEED